MEIVVVQSKPTKTWNQKGKKKKKFIKFRKRKRNKIEIKKGFKCKDLKMNMHMRTSKTERAQNQTRDLMKQNKGTPQFWSTIFGVSNLNLGFFNF